jgi:hypothetical protein
VYSVWLEVRAVLKTQLETQLLPAAAQSANRNLQPSSEAAPTGVTANVVEGLQAPSEAAPTRTAANVVEGNAQGPTIDNNVVDASMEGAQNDSSPLSLEELMELWKKDNGVLNNLPLKSLCPACFGSNPQPEEAIISFDGNFQQRRFNRHLPFEIIPDNRMFVQCPPGSKLLQVLSKLLNLVPDR